MKNVWMISLVSLLFVFTSCKSDEKKIGEAVSSFYSNVYTARFDEAMKYCTPESRSVVRFFKDTYKNDTVLLKGLSKLKINVKVTKLKISNENEASASVVITGLPVFMEAVGSEFVVSEEPAYYEVKLYKVDGDWKVTADLYGLL